MKAIVFDTSAIYASHFLENELGMTRPTIMKAIKGLQEKQLVKKENNFNNGIITANTYKINLFKYN